MKKIIIPIIFSFISFIAISQNVGINSTGATPNTSAILDVDATNKGLLVPRVNLLTTTDIATIASPATSLLVYNTNTTISGVGANGIGYYYYDGTKWIKLISNNNTSTAWLTTGNSGTLDGTNFIGTTDNIPLNFRINNNKAGRIDSTNANVFFGSLAGSNTTAQRNVALGHFALRFNSTGQNNTAVGNETLLSSYGNNNTAIGYQALYSAPSVSSDNISIGYQAMKNYNGNNNIAIGTDALSNYTNCSGNIGIGQQALSKSSGFANIGIGQQSLINNTFGEYNVGIGYQTLFSNTTGNSNVALGTSALLYNTIGNFNTAGGVNALNNNSIGNHNTANGYAALYNNSTGIQNTAVGSNALYNNTIATNNVAIGYNTLYFSNKGSYNTAIGNFALYTDSIGNYNTAIGFRSLYSNRTGISNTVNGSNAMYSNTSGSYNTAIGELSLYSLNTGNFNTSVGSSTFDLVASSDYCTSIGSSSTVSNGLTNATAIGAYAKAEQNNSLILGSINGINGATANTNVGIGITTPNAPLQFGSSFANRKIALFDVFNNDHNFHGFGVSSEGLRYQIISNSFSHIFYAGTSATTSKELMRINGNGNVGINQSNPTTAKLVISGTSGQEGLDLSSTDQYANLRVIRNSLGSDKDMFIGFQSGATSTLHLYSDNTETMTIKGNNAGIGITAPLAKLHVAGAFLADGAQTSHPQGAWLEWNKNSGDGKTYLLNQKGLGAGGFVIGEVSAANVITERITIDNNGNVGIGTTLPLLQKFTVIGNGTFSGTVNASCGILTCSDIRYKKDIQPLQNTLSKVIQLKGVSYFFNKEDFKDKNFNDNKQVGLIAQEVEKIYPELVQTDEQGYKSIDYAKLTPILVEAIKELKTQNDILKEDNIQLKTSVQKLDSSIQSIEKLLKTILPTYQASK